MLKQTFIPLCAVLILTACTPEENNTGDNNGNAGTVHVTGISLDRPTATPHTSTGTPLPRKV